MSPALSLVCVQLSFVPILGVRIQRIGAVVIAAGGVW
jgi:hypothetical protein